LKGALVALVQHPNFPDQIYRVEDSGEWESAGWQPVEETDENNAKAVDSNPKPPPKGGEYREASEPTS
jgi:hypothetical protein